MLHYQDGSIDELPELITGKSATPAAEHLFSIRDADEAKYLLEEKATAFHHTTAQLIFLSSRARRDIQTAVSFLTTRVKKLDEDDWGKLKKTLKCLNGTKRLKLTLTIDSMGIIKWFNDGSHSTHWDCKGHGGTMMIMGWGAICSYPRKIKVNTRSSTETGMVLVDAYMPEALWYIYFIQAQGYGVKHAEVHQDNFSAQMLETNGKFSSSRKTKHIKTKFFFFKDKVESEEIKIVDCPAGLMWADFLTKPLQGTAFRKMGAQLMNYAMEYIDGEETPTKKRKTLLDQASQQDAIQTVQECVGRYPKNNLGTRRVINRAVLRGTDGRRTGMRTQ